MSLEYKVLGQDTVLDLSTIPFFVAFGGGTVGAYSTDGITWTQNTTINSGAVAYGDGRFVVVSNTSVASYSTDGITWTQTTMPTSDTWRSVTYGGGKFVAVAYQSANAAYSTDGIIWTQTTLPSSATWKSVTYGDGKFVTISNVIVGYSTDGITWVDVGLPENRMYNSISYGSDKFVAVGFYLQVAVYSTNGITWTETAMPFGTWTSLTYGDGKFVAVASSFFESTAAYSTDGITWTKSATPQADWFSVTYGNGKFVAVAYQYQTASYSTDGITWTETAMPTSAGWQHSAYGGIAVLSNKTQYTVPSTKEAIISSIYIANNSASSKTYSVAVVPNGETLSSIHYIRKDVAIDANDFQTIDTKLTLSEGDQIITEGSSDEVSINMFGVEK